MRKSLAALVLAASTALASCAGVDPVTTGSIAPAFNPMDTVVRVALPDGSHGSGFHVGGGIIITAAHVVRGQILGSLEWEGGEKHDAAVLWSAEAYDVGAMQAHNILSKAANIECRVPKVGERLTAYGNPGNDNFLAIPAVAVGSSRKRGPWETVQPLALGAQGGISGGPVFDADGDVVGIVVGASIAPIRRTDAPKGAEDYDLSNTGIAYMVPGYVLCVVLGRL